MIILKRNYFRASIVHQSTDTDIARRAMHLGFVNLETLFDKALKTEDIYTMLPLLLLFFSDLPFRIKELHPFSRFTPVLYVHNKKRNFINTILLKSADQIKHSWFIMLDDERADSISRSRSFWFHFEVNFNISIWGWVYQTKYVWLFGCVGGIVREYDLGKNFSIIQCVPEKTISWLRCHIYERAKPQLSRNVIFYLKFRYRTPNDFLVSSLQIHTHAWNMHHRSCININERGGSKLSKYVSLSNYKCAIYVMIKQR